jgi:hypothetical protein
MRPRLMQERICADSRQIAGEAIVNGFRVLSSAELIAGAALGLLSGAAAPA